MSPIDKLFVALMVSCLAVALFVKCVEILHSDHSIYDRIWDGSLRRWWL